MADSSRCSVGISKDEDCNKYSYVKETGLANFDDLRSIEKSIIRKRPRIETIATICYHHIYLLLVKYECHQFYCCDPFMKHIEGIEFIYIDSKEVIETRNFLEKQLVNAFTVPGTRNFHQFFLIDKLNSRKEV